MEKVVESLQEDVSDITCIIMSAISIALEDTHDHLNQYQFTNLVQKKTIDVLLRLAHPTPQPNL